MQSILSILFALVLSLGISLAAGAETVPVRLMMGTREIVVSPPARHDGTRVLAPLVALNRLGISSVAASDGKHVSVIGRGDSSVDVPVVIVEGTARVSLEDVLKIVGAEMRLDTEKRTVSVRANLTSVEFADGLLRINCTMPVMCLVSTLGNRIIVDLPGTKLATEAKEVYVGSDVVSKARLGQYAEDTARVVLDLTGPAGYKIESNLPSSRIVVRVAEDIPLALPEPQKPPSGAEPFDITGIDIEPKGDSQFDLVMQTAGRGSVDVVKPAIASEVTLILKGGRLSQNITQVAGEHPLLTNVRFAQGSISPPLARVHLNLNRTVVTSLKIEDSQIRLGVRLPDRAGGSLADRLVVIDPGHGGSQPGACAANVKEKDVNMKIAAALVDALKKAGARTILTRSTDVTMDLSPRPEVATGNNADFFISIHCNSNLKPDSNSGIETYYYRNGESPVLMAHVIQKATCKATGMADRGARPCGFKVLRLLENTTIPGVLLECGYLNHSRDRAKLLNEDHRKKLAEGIVAGLRAYVEGTPL